jgi:hypothetical protein
MTFVCSESRQNCRNRPAAAPDTLLPPSAPPSTTSDYGNSAIGNTERIVVSWCTNPGYGTRLIPSGAIKSAHFIKTPLYVQVGGDWCGCESEADHGGVVQQVTGGGDLTMLNIPAGDEGGELDPHGMSPVSDEVTPRLAP